MFRRVISALIIGAGLMVISGCQKEEPLKKVDDVCSVMYSQDLKDYCYNWYDADKDGKVSMKEAASATYMGVAARTIEYFYGLEYFTNLEELNCMQSKVVFMDVSGNKKLKVLNCAGNQLKSLDLSQNKSLETLSCEKNQLTSLDVSNNTQLKNLFCDRNQLTSLDVSKNTMLYVLYCGSNKLTEIDLSNTPQLAVFSCSKNKIQTMDLSGTQWILDKNQPYDFAGLEQQNGIYANVLVNSKQKSKVDGYLSHSGTVYRLNFILKD